MRMRERNRYRDLVIIGAALLLLVYARGRFTFWQREQNTYGFWIQSQTELTKSVVGEFAKLLGVRQFLPAATVGVTLKLEGFTLETELKGISLDAYPLRWKQAKDSVRLGNTAALFLGADSFLAFSDKNGYAPTKSQVDAWIAGYRELTLTVVDETGRERPGKVFGILEEPREMVCMDQGQMERVFGTACQVRGGYLEIHGFRNAKEAKEALLGAGLSVETAFLLPDIF